MFGQLFVFSDLFFECLYQLLLRPELRLELADDPVGLVQLVLHTVDRHEIALL